MDVASGINIGSVVGGGVSLQAGGDIVAGNKIIINTNIQGLAKALPTTPYKFLASYDIVDRDIFYGRAAVVDELAGEAKRHKAIIINGASGAGKSSLVNAGLIPRLADNGYSYVAFREYSDPLEQLMHLGKLPAASPVPRTEVGSAGAAALPPQAADGVASSANGEPGAPPASDLNDPGLLLKLIRAAGATPIAVVLDQFERFFVNVPLDKRSAFIRAFKHCLQHSSADEMTFVIVLRHEFYGQLLIEFEAQIPEFSNEAYRLNLLPLTQSEAREAIVKPLENTNLKIQYDEDFVDNVLLSGLAAQAGGNTTVNPSHLQIVCNRLFEVARQRLQKRSSVLISKTLYDKLGGVQTILNTYLDTMVEEVARDPERITAVRSVLQRMIDTTGTRRFVSQEQLKRELPDVNEDEILKFLHKLRDRRMVEERNTTYSLSHEYLVKRVKEWFDPSEMERKRAQETLERGLAEWKNSKALLNRAQVEAVRKWVTALNSEEQELLQDSEADYLKREREEAEREKQLKEEQKKAAAAQKRTARAILIGLVVAVFVAGIAIYQWRQAEIAQILTLQRTSEVLLTLHQDFDALIPSVKAFRKLNGILGSLLAFSGFKEKAEIQRQINSLLQEEVYEVRERNRLEKHTDEVIGVNFSPDGKIIATASKDKTVKLWNLNGEELQTLTEHKDLVGSVIFSPDGKLLATNSWDGSAKLWTKQGEEWKLFKTLEENNKKKVFGISFSPDGRLLATANEDGTIKFWDREGKRINTIEKAHDDSVLSISFSPDGRLFTTAGADKLAKLWDSALITTSATPVAYFWGRDVQASDKYGIRGLWPPSSVAEIGRWGDRSLWTRQGKELKSFQHSNWVRDVSFSHDGTMIATASKDTTVKLWKLDGTQLKEFKGKKEFRSVRFSHDDKIISATSADNNVHLLSLDDGEEIQTLTGHKDEVWANSFSPNGDLLATASKDKTVKIWKVRTQRGKEELLSLPADNIIFGTFSPDGKEIATASRYNIFRIWSRDGKELQNFQVDNQVTAISFRPDSQQIAIAGKNGTVELWNYNDLKRIKSPCSHNSAITSVSFSPDGKKIATASEDKTVKLCSLDGTESKLTEILTNKDRYTDPITSVSFSPNGNIIATASWNWVVDLWTPEGKLIKTIDDQNGNGGHKDGVHSVSFSPDGNIIATASEDKTVKLWTPEGELINTKNVGDAGVLSVIFSPDRDGRLLATAGADNTVRLWRLEGKDLKELKTFRNHAPVLGLSFSDSKTIAFSNGAGRFILWDLNLTPDDLLKRGCEVLHDYLKTNQNARGDSHLCDGIVD